MVLSPGILSRGRLFVSSRVGTERWCARGAGSAQPADPCHHQTPPGFQLSLRVFQFFSGWFKFTLVFLGWASWSLCKLTLRNHCVISADVLKKKFRASRSSWQYTFMLLDGLARSNLYHVTSLHTQLSLTLEISSKWGVAPEFPLQGVGSD